MAFWIIKIVAASLGWTAVQLAAGTLGDTKPHVSVQLYVLAAAATGIGLLALGYIQINARKFDRWIYWLTFVVSTICATSIGALVQAASFSLYPIGIVILLACFAGALFAWRQALGAVDVERVVGPGPKFFYWISIVLAQAVGFQLAESVASTGMGYAAAAGISAVVTAGIAYAHFKTSADKLLLFWSALVVTCPLSVEVVDFIFKPLGHGGLALGSVGGALALVLAVAGLIYILPLSSVRDSSEERTWA